LRPRSIGSGHGFGFAVSVTSVENTGRPFHSGCVSALAYGPAVHRKSHWLMQVVVWPAPSVKKPTWFIACGNETSMMCTAPYGNVAPEVAGEVKPRGSREMNRRLRRVSTSTSSFSQMYMGSDPMSDGAAGSDTP
jgi:hypothetical protein